MKENSMENFENSLLLIVKTAIKDRLNNTNKLDSLKDELMVKYPDLGIYRASLVTLNLHNKLRGYVGSLIAYRTLYEDLVSNAISAGFDDPRFNPISSNEFINIEFGISLLSEPKEIFYEDINELKSQINIGTDGVILRQSSHNATFLPEVWEKLIDFDNFFHNLCHKAKLDVNCIYNHPQIFTFQVQKIK
jgi:AmmeMemoRadiSam system protein A